MAGDSFNLGRLRQQAKPFRLHWFPRLRSTNDHAVRLRKRGELFAPAIVLTGNQIAGRGRNTNTWWSDEGSLTVTFVLPIEGHIQPHQVPLIAGLCVRNALAKFGGEDQVQLKWPNDLLYRGRKLAGLLCERTHKADLIGLGVNVNSSSRVPASLKNRVVSLSDIAGQRLDKAEVLIAVVKELQPTLLRRSEHTFSSLLRQYDRHHALVGRRITVTTSPTEPVISGQCEGLDSMGRLLVRHRGQLHRIIAGQIDI